MRRPGSLPRTLAAGLALIAAAAGLLAGACATAPQPEAPRPPVAASVTAARDLGVAWLVSHQNADGSFGTFESARPNEIFLDTLASHRAFSVATSALCTWALLAPGRTDPAARQAFERGLAWLLATPPVGRATGHTFYDTWAHNYLLDLAAAVLADPALERWHGATREVAAREVLLARDRQSLNGGWGYYDFGASLVNPSGEQSTSFNTAAMILALLRVRERGVAVPDPMMADALVALERFRLPSGAFIYGTYAELRPQAGYNTLDGSSGRLQVCTLALRKSGVPVDDQMLLDGVDQLRRRHHYIAIGRGRPIPHEAFYYNSGYYYFFGHFYAAEVLRTLPESPRREDLASWLGDVFRADQHVDGSWFDYPLYGYGHAYATAYSVLALTALEELRPAAPPAGRG